MTESTTKSAAELRLNDHIKIRVRGRLCKARVCLTPRTVSSGSISFGAKTVTGKLYVRRADPSTNFVFLGNEAPIRRRRRR